MILLIKKSILFKNYFLLPVGNISNGKPYLYPNTSIQLWQAMPVLK